MTRRERRRWERRVRELHIEAAGVMRLMLVTADARAMIAAATLEDRSAFAYLRALDRFREWIASAADDSPLCLTCDRRRGADTPLFVLVVPARTDAAQCLAAGICAECMGRHPDSAAAVAEVAGALRMLWPDLRPIPAPSGMAGSA